MKKLYLCSVIACVMSICLVTETVAADLESSLQDLSRKLSAQLVEKDVEKVAVVGFTDLNGYKSALGDFISEEVVTALIIAGGFDVVERRELDRVLSEQSGYSDGIFDRSTTAELQKLLGIDALITGSITNLGRSVKINARAISVETAKAFAAASISLQKDETIESLLGQVASSGSSTPTPRGSSGFRQQSSDTYFKNSFLHVIPTAVTLSADGEQLRVATEFRNITKEPINIAFIDGDGGSAVSDGGDALEGDSIAGLADLRKVAWTNPNRRSDPERYTVIDAGSHAVVVWIFELARGSDSKKIMGTSFAISGELARLKGSTARSFSVGLSGLQL